jgi:hypothetical protein
MQNLSSVAFCIFANTKILFAMALMNYKLFGRTGLRVSEISLGAMTFGTEWGTGADYASSREVFDAYCEAKGNSCQCVM